MSSIEKKRNRLFKKESGGYARLLLLLLLAISNDTRSRTDETGPESQRLRKWENQEHRSRKGMPTTLFRVPSKISLVKLYHPILETGREVIKKPHLPTETFPTAANARRRVLRQRRVPRTVFTLLFPIPFSTLQKTVHAHPIAIIPRLL